MVCIHKASICYKRVLALVLLSIVLNEKIFNLQNKYTTFKKQNATFVSHLSI